MGETLREQVEQIDDAHYPHHLRAIYYRQHVGAVGDHDIDRLAYAGLEREIARFRLDPRDRREEADYYRVIGDDEGVFGCMSLLGCQDVCPKGLSLQTQIAYLRRAMARAGLFGGVRRQA